MMGTEHYTTEAMAMAEGAKECPEWTTTALTSSATTTSTTPGLVGAYMYNSEVYFHVCAHGSTSDDVLCEWQRHGTTNWMAFGGQAVCLPNGMCKCSPWQPGAYDYWVRVSFDNESHISSEDLAFNAGQKICQTTTVTSTMTTTTTTIQAVGVSNLSYHGDDPGGAMSKTFYFELCSVSPVTSLTCEFRRINETEWHPFPGDGHCFDGGCICPPYTAHAVLAYEAGLTTTSTTLPATSTTNTSSMTSTASSTMTTILTMTATSTTLPEAGKTNDDDGSTLPKAVLALAMACLSALASTGQLP